MQTDFNQLRDDLVDSLSQSGYDYPIALRSIVSKVLQDLEQWQCLFPLGLPEAMSKVIITIEASLT